MTKVSFFTGFSFVPPYLPDDQSLSFKSSVSSVDYQEHDTWRQWPLLLDHGHHGPKLCSLWHCHVHHQCHQLYWMLSVHEVRTCLSCWKHKTYYQYWIPQWHHCTIGYAMKIKKKKMFKSKHLVFAHFSTKIGDFFGIDGKIPMFCHKYFLKSKM